MESDDLEAYGRLMDEVAKACRGTACVSATDLRECLDDCRRHLVQMSSDNQTLREVATAMAMDHARKDRMLEVMAAELLIVRRMVFHGDDAAASAVVRDWQRAAKRTHRVVDNETFARLAEAGDRSAE